jgi:taurine--2-oxoglutarate transaminase
MGELMAGMKKRGVLPFANFNRLHVVPPCTVTDEEAKEGLGVLDEAFSDIDHYYVGA